MNRTDRLMAIVLELQGKGKLRAEDLAATFEISKRTVYRDVQALCEAGVPVISEPGLGYWLAEGYFLPPLRFTTDEGVMLLLGSDLMAQTFDTEYRAAAQSASRKIAGALPEAVRQEVQYLHDSIRFIALGALAHPTDADYLRQVRQAIIRRQVLRFVYHTKGTEDGRVEGKTSSREADPHGLVYFGSAWQMVAYCHTRRTMRIFRLSRVEDLKMLPQTFNRRADFDLKAYLATHKEDHKLEGMVARVLVDREISRWVQETRPFYVTDSQETPDGLILTFRMRQEQEILHWLLSWGRHIRVLEPDSLRQLLADEVNAMLRNLEPELVLAT